MARREDPTDPGSSDGEASAGPITHDWDRTGRPSTAVVEAVAAVTDCTPLDLPPLYRYVDAEALDVLVTGGANGTGDGVRVSFEYDGVVVTVDSYDGITVRPAAVEGS